MVDVILVGLVMVGNSWLSMFKLKNSCVDLCFSILRRSKLWSSPITVSSFVNLSFLIYFSYSLLNSVVFVLGGLYSEDTLMFLS